MSYVLQQKRHTYINYDVNRLVNVWLLKSVPMHNENKYQFYGLGPIIVGKFDRSCLIWVYGFQLYLFTGKSIDFERNRMAPEIWLALRVEFGLISCFVVRTFLDYLIGYNLKISFSYYR